MIPLSVPHISQNEWTYIKDCLDTEWVSSAGKYVCRFEDEICSYTGSPFAISCITGTAALHIALKLADVQDGDEVIVPTVTFIATVNVITYVGANPVFMDCDDYYNMDSEKVINFIKTQTLFKDGITRNKTTHRRIAAIIPVHVFGNAVRLEDLVHICRERNIKIIEDASESLGSVYSQPPFRDRHTGTIGDLGCYSFNGNKIITTGGGGMLVMADPDHAEKARYLTTQAKDDPVRYIHNEVGYNYRMTNIQAALGVAQLEQLELFLAIKTQNYELYKEAIDSIPGLHLAHTPPYSRNNHWMYPLQIDPDVYGKNREELMRTLQEEGIQTRPLWHLVHLQKPYQCSQTYQIEKAFSLHKNTLNIPCSVGLKKEEIDHVIRILQK